MNLEEYIFVVGVCIMCAIAVYDAIKDAALWLYDEWLAYRLRRVYRKLYWFLED